MKDHVRLRLQVVGAVLSVVVALSSALSMRDHVRLVDILTLFAGGMGTGVTIAQIAAATRAARDRQRR